MGCGPPLYFVNGFAGAAALYSLAVWLLRDEFRCILYDVEPAGRAGPISLGEFAEDLLAAASLHGDASFAAFGATAGGTIVLQAAVVAPERVERVILQSVPARCPLTWAERSVARWYVNSRRPVSQLPGRLRVQTFNHRRWFPPLDPDRWAFFLEMTGQQPVALPARQALALSATDLRPQLSSIQQPVLIVDTEGTGQRLSALQREAIAGLSSGRVEQLHTTGLHPYLTHPHRLVKLIQAWWSNAPHA